MTGRSSFPLAGGWSTVAARHSLDSGGIYGHSVVQVCRIGASGCLKQHLLPLPAWILHRKFAQKQVGALFFFFWRKGIRFGLSHVSTYTSTASLLSQINGCPSSWIRIRSWHNAEDYGTERKAIVLLTSQTKPRPPSRSLVLLAYFHGRSWRSSHHGHFSVKPLLYLKSTIAVSCPDKLATSTLQNVCLFLDNYCPSPPIHASLTKR